MPLQNEDSLQPNYSDQELRDLLQTDSERAIEWMFRQYYAMLSATVYRILPRQELAEDLVQELFLDLWRKKDTLQFQTSTGAYLRRAVVNKTLNHIRDAKMKFDGDEPADTIAGSLNSPLGGVEVLELQQAIDQAVDRLPERCRIVFALSRYEQMSQQEIALSLGISIKTVENQMTKALRSLRNDLTEFLEK